MLSDDAAAIAAATLVAAHTNLAGKTGESGLRSNSNAAQNIIPELYDHYLSLIKDGKKI